MKRDITSLVSDNGSDKWQCVIHNPNTTKNNSVNKLEISKTNQPRSVSSISGLTPETITTESLSIIQCSANWIQMQKSVITEGKKIKIEAYVKHHLFKDLKFIPSQEMMVFSSQKQSPNYLVCHNLNIKVEEY